MRFHSFLIMILFFCSDQLWAQNLLPENPTENELKNLFLNLKAGPTPEDVQTQKNIVIKERIQNYLDDSRGASGMTYSKTLSQDQRGREFLDCIKSSLKANVIKSFNCRSDWDALMRGDVEDLRRRGLHLPDDFAKNLKEEINVMDQNLKSYQKEDEVTMMKDLMVFEEVGPEELINLQAIDPNIKELGQDVKQIVLNISRSRDAVEAIQGQKNNSVPDELFVLGEMLEMISGTNCENEATFIANYGSGMDLLKGLAVQGDKDKTKRKETGSYILGIEEERNPNDVVSYRFVEKGTTYYLYPAKKNLQSENWVMGILSPEGNLQFRYFKLQNVQPDKTDIWTEDDVSLVKANRQQAKASFKNENKFYFQAQEGLVIRADEVTAPIVGRAVIPEAKLIIGRVHMAYLTKKTVNQTDITIRHDDIVLSTESRPLSSKWSVGGQVKVSPLDGKWTMNSNARIQNFLLGYGKDSKGQSSANVSYILSRNFMSLQADSKKSAKMSVGRQFRGGKGYVMTATDFSRFHEIKFVLFIK